MTVQWSDGEDFSSQRYLYADGRAPANRKREGAYQQGL